STVTPGPFSKFFINIPGGSTVVAGSPFLFKSQAADQFGNLVSNYTGPTSVTLASSPPDPQSSFTGTLNSGRFGVFLGNFKTAGSYMRIASAGTFSGSSAPVTVLPADASYFTVTAPATATTGNAINVTVTAFDHFGNLATGYKAQVQL